MMYFDFYLELYNQLHQHFLNQIKDKEKYILLNRYIIGKTQMELSTELGISQAQISRLEKNGIEDIKRLIL